MTNDIADAQAGAVPSYPMKVVLEHITGPLAGLFQICGDATKEFKGQQPDVFVPDVGDGRSASLVASKRRFLLYREVYAPNGQNGMTFNERQQ